MPRMGDIFLPHDNHHPAQTRRLLVQLYMGKSATKLVNGLHCHHCPPQSSHTLHAFLNSHNTNLRYSFSISACLLSILANFPFFNFQTIYCYISLFYTDIDVPHQTQPWWLSLFYHYLHLTTLRNTFSISSQFLAQS